MVASIPKLSIVKSKPKVKEEVLETKSHSKPSKAQSRYLRAGLKQAGGKLPLFDDKGQEIDQKTIRSCVEKGWAEPWFNNPVKPTWLVCKLTEAGRAAVSKV